eukprot:547192-Pyramimonas_sp.AAC.1
MAAVAEAGVKARHLLEELSHTLMARLNTKRMEAAAPMAVTLPLGLDWTPSLAGPVATVLVQNYDHAHLSG